MGLMDIGSGVLGLAGGILGADENRDSFTQAGDAQKAAINAMIAKLDAVGMPPDQSAALILNQYKQAGILTPALEKNLQDAVSNYGNIKQNQQATSFQSQALQRMSQLGQAGLTPDERAQMRANLQQAAQQNNGAQEAIIQNMAQRGQQGGGAEIAARLASAQGGANMASQVADNTSSLAAQRALAAISQGAGLAGQMEQQNFGEQSSIASAQDQMNRFNTQNQMAIQQRNVNTANQAQAGNLAMAQNISSSNVAQNNQELYNQQQRQRQNWLDKLSYAKAYAAPLEQYGQAASQQAFGEGQARTKGIANGFGGLTAMMGQFGSLGGSGGGGGENQGQGPTVSNAPKVPGYDPYRMN